jgi:hypothetical protein
VLPQGEESALKQRPIKALPVPLGLVCFGRHHVIIIAAIAAGTLMSANTGSISVDKLLVLVI